MRSYLTHLQNQNDLEAKEIQGRHAEEMNRLIENHADQADQMKKAFDVSISKEAEELEQRLHETRLSHDQRVADEKHTEEEELNKLKTAHQQRIEEYKKASESQMDTMRKQLQAQSEQLHEQAIKTAKREGVRT